MGAEAIGGAAAEDDEAYGLGILEDGRGVCAKCHVQMANGWVANFRRVRLGLFCL